MAMLVAHGPRLFTRTEHPPYPPTDSQVAIKAIQDKLLKSDPPFDEITEAIARTKVRLVHAHETASDIQDFDRMAARITEIVSQDLTLSSLEERLKSLYKLHTSKAVQSTLTLYSETVIEIKKKAPDLVTLARKASETYSEIIYNQDPDVEAECRRLYNELLGILQQATNAATQDDSLARLKQRITIPAGQSPQEDVITQATRFVEANKASILASDHPLRKDKARFQAKAKALVQLESDIRSCRDSFVTHTITRDRAESTEKTCRTLLEGLEWLVAQDKQKLKGKPLRETSFARWNSLSFLTKEIGRLRCLLKDLSELTTSTYRFGMNAVHKLTVYLQNPYPTLTQLIEAIGAASALRAPVKGEDGPRVRIYKLVDQCLATTHKRALELSDIEAQTLGKLLTNAKADDAIKTYLLKGLVRHVHFDRTTRDAKFDLAFFIAKNDPLYSEWFQGICNTHTEFRELASHYQNLFRTEADFHDLYLLKQGISLLIPRPYQLPDEEQLRYAEAQTLSHSMNRARKHLVDLLHDRLQTYRQEHVAVQNIEQEPLYELLTTALFSPRDPDQIQANTLILQHLQGDEPHIPKHILFTTWLLKNRLKQAPYTQLLPIEKKLLSSFFESYLNDRTVWVKQFGLGYMEELLYLFSKGDTTYHLEAARQNAHFDTWTKVIERYRQLANAQKEQATILIEEAKQAIGEENLPLATKVNPQTHLDFAVLIYEEMLRLVHL